MSTLLTKVTGKKLQAILVSKEQRWGWYSVTRLIEKTALGRIRWNNDKAKYVLQTTRTIIDHEEALDIAGMLKELTSHYNEQKE